MEIYHRRLARPSGPYGKRRVGGGVALCACEPGTYVVVLVVVADEMPLGRRCGCVPADDEVVVVVGVVVRRPDWSV